MIRNAIGIRTHKIDDAIKKLAENLSPVFGVENVFIICDVTNHGLDSCVKNSKNTMFIGAEELVKLGLKFVDKWGWQCGDYFYYKFSSELNYDYYWLIEPDVSFDISALRQLFDDLTSDTADFIAVGHGARDSNWYWSKSLELLESPVYGCLFPFSRVSSQAVKFLHEKRKYISASTNLIAGRHKWPNDEGFVSTVLEANGFICKDMKKCTSVRFDNFTTTIPLLRSDVPYPGFSHPVLEWGEYIEKFPLRASNYYRGGGGSRTFLQKSMSNLTQDQIFEVIEKILLKR
jgi:hypothetical protein